MSDKQQRELLPHRQALKEMIRDRELVSVIYPAAKCGFADHLKEGSKTIDELVELTNPEPDPHYQTKLEKYMRNLAVLGIVEENEPGRFSLTPMGALLRSDDPNSLCDFAIALGETRMRQMERLLRAVFEESDYRKLMKQRNSLLAACTIERQAFSEFGWHGLGTRCGVGNYRSRHRRWWL